LALLLMRIMTKVRRPPEREEEEEEEGKERKSKENPQERAPDKPLAGSLEMARKT
jgi:hypothetical protein